MLEIDSLFHLLAASILLIAYGLPGQEARLLPDQTRRARQVTNWILRAAQVALMAGHLPVSVAVHAPPFVRWAMAALGVYWSWNLISGVLKDRKKTRQAKELMLPVPEFSVAKIASGPLSLAVASVLFPIGAVATAALMVLLRALQRNSLPWLVLLAGPSILLCLAVILFALFLLALDSGSKGLYLALERDIVLEGLTELSQVGAIIV